MLQADVEELRARLEEKNRLIEKKTQAAAQAVQERNRVSNELTELKDHMDIKDRKINVLQRKVCHMDCCDSSCSSRATKHLALMLIFTRNFGVHFRLARKTFSPTFLLISDEIYILGR